MPDASWLLFTLASLVLIATPGQDMILVMSRSVAQGARAGLTFAVKGPVGLFAGLLSGWLRRHPGALVWLHRGSGAVLLALGVRLLFERRQ